MNISPEQFSAQEQYIPDDLSRCEKHPNGQVRRFIDYRQWRTSGVPWLKEFTGATYECATCGTPLHKFVASLNQAGSLTPPPAELPDARNPKE